MCVHCRRQHLALMSMSPERLGSQGSLVCGWVQVGVGAVTVCCVGVGTVHDIVTRGGRCLIPVFALGRAQELLLILGMYIV